MWNIIEQELISAKQYKGQQNHDNIFVKLSCRSHTYVKYDKHIF